MATKEQDPTQQGKNRSNALSKIDSFEQDAYAILDDWVANEPRDSNALEFSIMALLFSSGNFFLNSNIESAMRSGVFGASRDAEQELSKALGASGVSGFYDPTFTLSSDDYRSTLSAYQEGTQEAIQGNVSTYVAQIAALVALGLANKRPLNELIADARDRIRVMKVRITQGVVTGINQGLNASVMLATEAMASAIGKKPMVEHLSALLPTTRAHHASRHKRIYTVQQQREWWSKGANRINCYCVAKPHFK